MSDIEQKLLAVVAGRDEISNPDLVTIYDYWIASREGGSLPGPADIDLLELEDHLNDIYLFDVVDNASDHRCVYNGNFHKLEKTIVDLGETIASMPASGLKGRARLVFDTVVQLKQPVQMSHARSTLEGKEFQVLDFLCLPLSENGDEVSRTLTIMKRSASDPSVIVQQVQD